MRLQRQNSGLQQRNDAFYEASKVRQVKGNQVLNEELEMKAVELEKLFAQFISPRRITPTEEITIVQLPEKKIQKQLTEDTVVLNPNMNIVELGRLNNSKGRLYERYMQIRDSKLREESDSRRVQNEEKMKVMNEKLERIHAVMQTSSAGNFSQRGLAIQSAKRPEKFRSFDMRSVENNSDQKPREPVRMQDDYVSDSSENGSTRITRSKKLSHSRTFSSSAPRSTPPPIPRSASRSSNVGRRRIVPDSPVSQSVPNFSEFKEHNTNQSQIIRKETPRQQYSHIPRSKSTNGHTPPTKKEDVFRSQSMKKSSTNSNELSRGPNSTPYQKNVESKQFLRKGSGIGPGAGAGIAKMKATMESESTSSEEESSQIIDKREDSVNVVKETIVRTIPADSVADSSRNKQESDRSAVPSSEDIVILQMRSQVESDLASEIMVPPTAFHTPVKPIQDSPAQSPASWSSHTQSPFSCTYNRSDMSMESPRESPAPCNSKLFANIETDSPRSRKKWGATQNPLIMSSASEHQTNNVAKGIKRLLNFGRKTRGTEGLGDCISTTTSEGDDEQHEGRYLASRSSDDHRNSKTVFSQGHSSYESSNNDSEFINKEVKNLRSFIPRSPDNYKLKDHNLTGSLLPAPKSFFSLSSFRSKGSELKTR